MMRLIVSQILLLFCPLLGLASSSGPLDGFSGIHPSGPLPKCFTVLSTEKYKEAKAQISPDENRFERRSKQNFYLQSSFVVDQILQSGKVVYGDPVSEYLNAIVDVLLKNDPGLRARIQVFVTKSHCANASATDQGIIFVNTGLVARVHSEAELAYILAHEIAHIAEQHTISMHVEHDKMVKRRGKYNGIDVNDNFLNYNMMSKEQESEADEIAYARYYKNTAYCLDELDSCFSTLLRYESPFRDYRFSNSFFETELYRFPASYTVAKLDTVSLGSLEQRDANTESGSTHPATVNRRKAIGRLKVKDSNVGRTKYIVSEETFHETQALCQFESIKQMMLDRDYIDAIYNCTCLLADYPENKFLKETLASALYIYSQYKNKGEQYEIDKKCTEQSTEIKQLLYFFSKLSRDEMAVLALKNMIDVRLSVDSSAHIDAMADQLFYSVFVKYKMKAQELFSAQELITRPELNVAKTDKKELYYLNAFALQMDSKYVADNIAKYSKIKLNQDLFEKDKSKSKTEAVARQRKADKRDERRESLYGKALGLNKIVVVDPFYYKFNQKREEQLRLIESERKQLRFSDRIRECARITNLDVTVVSSKEFGEAQSEDFKYLSELKEWFDERLEHDLSYDIIPYSSSFMAPVVQYYGTSNIMWTGVLSERYRKPVGSVVAMSIIFTYGVTMPAVIAWACIPGYQTSYFGLLYDINSGQNLLTISNDIRTSDLSGDFVNAATYDAFYQINKSK